MKDVFLATLAGFHVSGWDGNRAEPLPDKVYEAAVLFADKCPVSSFLLARRGIEDSGHLVNSAVHLAAHEETPVFRFYPSAEIFGPTYFSVMVSRDGRYLFDFETSVIQTVGATNSPDYALKLLRDHLSELGDLTTDKVIDNT